MLDLPFEAQQVGDVSGKRELHNSTRKYFDAPTNEAHDVCRLVAAAFQDPIVVGAMARAFGVDLDGTNLRIEYAADTDGFWLEPHTDLGVKKLTFLYYVSLGPGQEDLGTDIYRSREEHWGRAPFVSNSALVFVPSADTWHGFEARPITGVRKSLIVNYVTQDWRAREQLAFPEAPVVGS
ncbi:MAG: 2OG-Fe(II) oxygenase [Salinarimonas sp.]